MNTPSCSMLELNDFGFKNNTCSGRCGVILSSRNQLRVVRVQHVRVTYARTVSAVVFYAPPESVCSVEHMDADTNDAPILHVDGGTLNVSGSTFAENDIDGSDDVASCIRLTNATGVFEDSQFRKNRARSGCAIAASRSNLTISDCAFEENKAKHAGVIHLTASNASIQSCDFSANQARRSAGILMAVESQIIIVDSSFEANAAGYDGGCFHLQSASTIELIRSTLSSNEAQNGAAAFLDQRSIGKTLDSLFINNSASSRGGSFCIEDSRLTVHECRFENGTAEHGAGICMNSSRLLVRDTSVSDMHSFKSGGFVAVTSSWTRFQNVALIGSHADNAGGGIAAWNGSHVEAKNLTSFKGRAEVGGTIYLNFGSSGSLIQCRFERNDATSHGGAVHVNRSTLEVDSSQFSESGADWGGILFAQDSEMNISNSSFDRGSGSYGGCMRLVGRSQSEVRDTVFTACHGRRVGGAVQLGRGSSSEFVDATFRNNSAVASGGTFHIEKAVASLNRCRFADGRADGGQRHVSGFGGFVYSCCGSRVAVKNSTMEEGIATENGGCLFARNSTLSVDGLTMMRCNASEDGGGMMVRGFSEADLKNIDIRSSRARHGAGIHVEESNITGQGWIVMDNDAVGSGGLFLSMSKVILENALMKNNSARFGGASYMSNNSTGIFGNVAFNGNSAVVSGGSLYVEHSILSVQKCRFTNGSAEYGGGIFALFSNVAVAETTASRNNASKRGGGVHLEHSILSVQKCRFTNGSAGVGGGNAGWNDSSIVDTSSVYSQDVANYGAAIFLKWNSSGTFTNCQFSTNAASTSGGAIYAEEASVKLKHCLFSNSSAFWGGFIYAQGSNEMNATNTEFRNGSASYGGCLYADESFLSVQRSIIQDCNALKNGGAMGFVTSSVVRLKTVDVFRNKATFGGGLYAANAEITTRRCNLKDNHADRSGGSLYIVSSIIRGRDLMLDSNVAIYGGGGYLSNSTLIVQDSIMQNNLAAINGGAMNFPNNTRGVFLNTTFTNNSVVTSGGSLYVEQSKASLEECILQRGSAVSGGLLYSWNASYVDISNSTFRDSNATWGGCLESRGGDLSIRNATMQGCRSTKFGGAMIIGDSATAIIAYSNFISNHARFGGFLALTRATVTGSMLIMKKNEASEEGGAIFSRKSALRLSSSLLEENSAILGGATFQEMNATSIFSNVTFTDNWARKEGGSVYSDESVLILNRCMLRNSSAQDGGFLLSWKDVLVNITESDLVQGSAREGGCVSATKTNLIFWRTSLLDCSASKDGGGLHVKEESNLQLIESSIERNRAAGSGGGLSCMSDSVVHLQDAQVRNNTAQSGGAMDVGLNTTGSLINVTFVDNSAVTGGHCHLQHSVLRIRRGHFSGGVAEKGGGFFVSESSLNISDSEFSTMRASLQGSFILSEERSSVVIENSSMVSGTSAVAGAVALISSDFRARHLRMSQCETEGDGGAIWGDSSSQFLCIDCVLRDNSARRGGSVYFEYSDAQTVTVQLIGTAVQNNSATFGGMCDQR